MRFFKFLFYSFALFFALLSKLTSFYAVSILVSKIPFSIGNYIRLYYYKLTIKNVGKNNSFSYGVIFSHKDITIGDNVRFGPFNTIGLVDFSDDIIIAQNVDFLSGSTQHGCEISNIPFWQQEGVIKKIKISSNVWIGTKSVIMNDIAKNTIVGAGSVVTKNFSSNIVIAGNPAKQIKELS